MALRTAVTPGAAQAESGYRTLVDLVVGLVLSALVSWLGTKGFNIKVDPKASEAIFGIIWGLLTIGTSVVKRRYWPTKTDYMHAGRTDLPAAPPKPLP
jgi:hypothetical protein